MDTTFSLQSSCPRLCSGILTKTWEKWQRNLSTCKFPCDLEDELHRRAVSEWLPTSGYELREAPEIGVIHWYWEEGNEPLNNSRYCELWLPIVKKADRGRELHNRA